jgi:glycosyltransferase involved in cell wall biosynthesis
MRQLTIAIPTYNRPLDLTATLECLGAQLNDQCILHILDNCSQFNIEDIVAKFRDRFSNALVIYTRNQTNIGASANFMRCFEMCSTPWLWLLSDDDLISNDAIEKILESANTHPDCVYINFKTGHRPEKYRPVSMKVSGFDELVHKMEKFDEQIFISTNIYQAHFFKEYMNIGYHFAYSLAPMFAMVTSIMSKNNNPCFLSEYSIVKPGPTKSSDESWALLPFTLGIHSLLDLPMKNHTRAILRKKIRVMTPTFIWIAFSLALQAKSTDGMAANSLYWFLQYIDRSTSPSYLSFERILPKFLIIFFFLPKWLLMKMLFLLERMKRANNVTAFTRQSHFQRT